MNGVTKIVSKKEFNTLIQNHGFVVVHFYAEWAAQCGPMNIILEEMSHYPQFRSIHFAKVEAEVIPDISVKYQISAVPTFLLFQKGILLDVINGANPADLTRKINKHAGTRAPTPPPDAKPLESTLEDRLDVLVKLADVMVFMKGNPTNPRCGFSRTLVTLLNETGVKYQSFDILNDEDVRQGLKKRSNWPTYPQVYVKGELVGGLDILLELKKNGELKHTLLTK